MEHKHPSWPTTLHTVSVNRSELVLQQNSLQPQWRTVEKTARPWNHTTEYFFCHSFCNSCKNTKGTMKCLVYNVLIRYSALNLPNRYSSDSCVCWKAKGLFCQPNTPFLSFGHFWKRYQHREANPVEEVCLQHSGLECCLYSLNLEVITVSKLYCKHFHFTQRLPKTNQHTAHFIGLVLIPGRSCCQPFSQLASIWHWLTSLSWHPLWLDVSLLTFIFPLILHYWLLPHQFLLTFVAVLQLLKSCS